MAAPARYTYICFGRGGYWITHQHEKRSDTDALGQVSQIEGVINDNLKYIGQDEYGKLTPPQLRDILVGKAQAIRDGYAKKYFASVKVVQALDAKLVAIQGHLQRYRAEREGMVRGEEMARREEMARGEKIARYPAEREGAAILNRIFPPPLMEVVFEYLPYANHLELADIMYKEQGESGRAHLARARLMAARKIGYRGDDAGAFIEGLDEDVRTARRDERFRGLHLQAGDGGGEFIEKVMALHPLELIGDYLMEFRNYPTLFQWLRLNFEIPLDRGLPPEDKVQRFRFGNTIFELYPERKKGPPIMINNRLQYLTFRAYVKAVVIPTIPASTAGQHGSKDAAATGPAAPAAPQGTRRPE